MTAADPDRDVPLDLIPLHSTSLLTVLDASGTVLYESPSIERVFGFDQDELVGDRVSEYFHPDDREETFEAFRDVVESDEYTVRSAEYRHERADGSYVWVESVASADPTPDGNYIINTRDISAQKAQERKLERTVEQLDQFARVVSHDLRNPLNVAEGRLELARDEIDNEHLDAVSRSHERMASLIDDLLTLARGGDRIDTEAPVEVAAIAEDCWQTVATADATLAIETEDTIHAGPASLRQLFENLFRNAVEHGSTSPPSPAQEDAVEHGSTSPRSQSREDAAEHGGDGVTVTVGALDDGFYVEDDGPGIPEAQREDVCDLGYSTTQGTGLGLGIVAEVVEAHGWQLRVVEGALGGARFEIRGVEILR